MTNVQPPYTWRRFAWACLKWAFIRWEQGEAYSTLTLTNVITAFSWLTGITGVVAFGMGETRTAAVSLALILVLAGVVAPYRLWKQGRLSLDDLEKALSPRLEVLASLEETGFSPSNDHCFVINLSNVKGGTIEDCQLTIRDIQVLIGGSWEILFHQA